MADDELHLFERSVEREIIPGRKKKTTDDDEFAAVVRGLSPQTREALKPATTPIPNAPAPLRYGGKPNPASGDEAPANLREAETELRKQGYTRGTRFGQEVMKTFGVKRKGEK